MSSGSRLLTKVINGLLKSPLGDKVCFVVFVSCVCGVDRTKDLEMFLEHTRAKFVGFQVKQDRESLAGLPQPIHEGVKVLKQVTTGCMSLCWQ